MTGVRPDQGQSDHWLAQRWGRLSTAVKMLMILSLGLLPLGIIAIAASIQSARESRVQAQTETRALLAVQMQRLTLPLARHAYTIRSARDAMAVSRDPAQLCRRTLSRLATLPAPGRYRLFGADAEPGCVSPDFRAAAAPAPNGRAVRVALSPETLTLYLYDPAGSLDGAAQFSRAALATLLDATAGQERFAVEFVQGEHIMALQGPPTATTLDEQIVASEPLAEGEYSLRVRRDISPLSIADVVSIATPVLMWLWASVVCWLLVQRLLLRPLADLQRAVDGYRPGDTTLALPPSLSPAEEIDALGKAFGTMTGTVARHERELESGLARQTKLVREVHHRVKNNLQVVASLLNIHSRGATEPAAAGAYASIQRRVDALAVVHRNHYAELEENRGVALRPLISELAANLRATAPAAATRMQIRVDIAPVHVVQDTAVSVAFLITEIAEFGMLCGASMVSITLERAEAAHARLTIEADSLAGGVECEKTLVDRFERVISGLARQLRSALLHEPERGLYAIDIVIVDDAD